MCLSAIHRRMKESIYVKSSTKSLPAGENDSEKESMKELTIAFTEAQAKCSGLQVGNQHREVGISAGSIALTQPRTIQ